jgi:tetratricopeptide (TPR) repeat protein
MSPRTRIAVVVAAAALVAAAAAVLAARAGMNDANGPKRPPGAPRLYLDLGVRADPEAQTLRRATRLYDHGDRAGAHALFSRSYSLQAEVGDAFAQWPAGTLARVRGLAAQDETSSFVQLHLGLAQLWSGDQGAAVAALQRAEKLEPDSASALVAQDLLHPNMVPGMPVFEPSFARPARLARLTPARQLVELRRAARDADPHAKLLYAIALAQLGHRVSAEREARAAVRLAPRDPETLTAAAVFRFDKERPSLAFGELGPLTKRFPHSATVRFHLGLLLLWIEQVKQAKVELKLAVRDEPRSHLAKQARQVLDRLD